MVKVTSLLINAESGLEVLKSELGHKWRYGAFIPKV